jgi:hypothetical protein
MRPRWSRLAEIVMPAKAGIQYSGLSRMRRLLDSGSRFAARSVGASCAPRWSRLAEIVMPAKAGIQYPGSRGCGVYWIPALALLRARPE